MTDAEWRQVENDYFKSQPIPPKLILKMLPWMFDKLPSTVREQRLAEAPLLYRVVYRLFRAATNARSDGPSATPPEAASSAVGFPRIRGKPALYPGNILGTATRK